MLAIGEILEDRRNRILLGIVGQPDAGRQHRTVLQRDQRVLDHPHRSGKSRDDHRGRSAERGDFLPRPGITVTPYILPNSVGRRCPRAMLRLHVASCPPDRSRLPASRDAAGQSPRAVGANRVICKVSPEFTTSRSIASFADCTTPRTNRPPSRRRLTRRAMVGRGMLGARCLMPGRLWRNGRACCAP